MNANIFDPDDYRLTVSTAGFNPYKSNQLQYQWSCWLYGKTFTCNTHYTTTKGAQSAGENWLRKNIHDDIL